jgi:hypothetical protein
LLIRQNYATSSDDANATSGELYHSRPKNVRRESYSNRLATALAGIDLDNPATVMGRTGGTVVVPRIVGPIRRRHPVEVRDVEFLRANTDRKIKVTLPGPFTMSRQAKNEFYKDEEELIMHYAVAVSAETRGEPARILGYAVSAKQGQSPVRLRSRHFHDINQILAILPL